MNTKETGERGGGGGGCGGGAAFKPTLPATPAARRRNTQIGIPGCANAHTNGPIEIREALGGGYRTVGWRGNARTREAVRIDRVRRVGK